MKNTLMKTLSNPCRKPAAVRRAGGYLFLLAGLPAMRVTQAAGLAATNTPAAIPWNQIGAKAGADYKGDGLAVTPTESGARLHCVFQQLDGEATPEGLWLTSTATNAVKDRFRVTAAAVGRSVNADASNQLASFMPMSFEGPPGFGVRQSAGAFDVSTASPKRQGTAAVQDAIALAGTGTVQIVEKVVRFLRPGLVEEYSVSLDGVRQDFLVPEPPAGAGELAVRLAVSGARVEPAAAGARPARYPQQIEEAEHGSSLSHGARLVLDNSGRKLAYSRLRATDATGRELTARMEIESNLESSRSKAEKSQSLRTSAATSFGMPNSALVVVVNDAEAVYPVRIDPTFSDANWISMMGGGP